jgi:hypothetical protein
VPTYTLHWEDRRDSGGTHTYDVIREAAVIGNFSPDTSWTARSISPLAGFDPVDDRVSMLMASGSGTFYVRRFRVEGDDGSVYYGAWPSASAVTYTADQQDGAGGEDYIGYDAGTGADANAVQFDLTLASFQSAGTALDWYFAPIVGGWAVGQVKIR